MGKSRGSKKRGKEDVVNNVNADVAMAAAVRKVREVLSEQSEEEIHEMLLRCDMNHYDAIERLVSMQELRSQQGTSTQLPDSSTTLVPNQSAITNGETSNVPISSTEAVPTMHVPSSSDVTNGETKTVAISSSEAVPTLSVPSSSAIENGETRSVPTSSNFSLSEPSSSAATNGETRSVPTSSNPPLSVPSSSATTNGETRHVPSSRAPTNVKTKRQATRMISASDPSMADVLRGLHVPSKQNLTKAPVIANSPLLHQKPDATNPIFNSTTESDAARDLPMDTRQNIAAASSMADPFGTYPSSEQHINQQGMNRGQYGNMINSPYLRHPARGGTSNSNTVAHPVDMMNYPSSWLDQNDASIYQSMDSGFAQYRNNTLSLSATSIVPCSSYGFDMSSGKAANSSGTSSTSPSHGSAFGSGMSGGNGSNSRLRYADVSRNHLPSGKAANSSRFGYEDVSRSHLPSNSCGTSSTGPSSHGSAFGFDITSGNAANSRLGRYEDVSRIILPLNSSRASTGPSSHGSTYVGGLSSGYGSNSRLGYEDVSRIQGRSPFEWRVEGEDCYRPIPPHSQPEREAYFERIRAQLASSRDQEYNTNDPTDHTQQRPGDK